MNLKKSLLKIKLKTIIILLSLSLSPSLANSDNPYRASSDPSNYSCQVNEECLNYLKDTLLNKTSDRGIYKYCSDKYENIKLCCVNPMECKESYGSNRASELKNNSLNEIEQSEGDALTCHLNQLSSLISSLSGVQSEFCSMGINVCKEDCLSKLQEVKNTFRECFSISNSYTIESILEKAKSSTKDQDCYNKMIAIADKYKRQSLNKLSLLREDLKSQDIINCEDIKESKTTKSLNNLARNVCHQAKAQKEEKIQQEEAQAEEERQQLELEEAQRLKNEADLLGSGDINEWKERQRKMREEIDAELGIARSKEEADSSSSANQNNNKNQSNNSNSGNNKSSQGGLNNNLLGAGAGALGAGLSNEGQFERPVYQTNQDSLSGSLAVSSVREEPEGFFGKIISKISSGFKKAVNKVKDILPFMDSEEELITKLEQLCSHKQALELRQVVHQVVKAPQIEPLEEQDKEPFNDYELLQHKPSGLIAKIDKTHWAKKGFSRIDFDGNEILKKFNFVLSLKINNETYNEILCSENLPEDAVRYKVNRQSRSFQGQETIMEPKKEHCVFQWEELVDNKIYKFIPLPTDSDSEDSFLNNQLGSVDLEILLNLKHKSSEKIVDKCVFSKKFIVNMLEPKKFKILWTGIKGEEENQLCKYYQLTINEMEDYFNSDEVQKHFYDMFPVSDKQPYKPEMQLIHAKSPIGVCDNKVRGNISRGLSNDILNLNKLRDKEKGDRIMALTPAEYAEYHKKNAGGFVYYIIPRWAFGHPLPIFFSRKSYQVGFIIYDRFSRDIHNNVIRDTTGRGLKVDDNKDMGIFLHELAHTFGQIKEFYDSTVVNPNDKTKYYCDQFTLLGTRPGEYDDLCTKYRTRGGLVREQFGGGFIWKLLNNQFGIMEGVFDIKYQQTVTGQMLYNKWMDRDTYQKILETLQNNLAIPDYHYDNIDSFEASQIRQKHNSLISCDKKKTSINISGIYHKEDSYQKKSFLTKFQVRTKEIESMDSFFFGGKFSIKPKQEESDYLKLELKEKNKVIEEIIFPRESYIKVFYKDGRVEKQELSPAPLFADFFPKCGFFNKKDYTVSVKEIYMENGIKKEMLLLDSMSIQEGNEEQTCC